MQLLVNVFMGIIKVLRYWQVLVLIVILHLFASWMVSSPLSSMMDEQWDHSLVSAKVEVDPAFQSTVYDELLIGNSSLMETIYSRPFFLAAAVSFLLLNIFIIAGAMPLYCGLDLKFNWDRFWSDAARYFRPFLGLAIVAGILFFAANQFTELVRGLIWNSLSESNDEASKFITGTFFTTTFRFLIFAFVVMVFQYAKLASAMEQIRNIIFLIRRAFGFVARNFLKAVILFAILGLIEFSISALDAAVWYYALPNAAIFFQWIWYIFITFLMMTIKFSYFSSQINFYSEMRRLESESGGLIVGKL